MKQIENYPNYYISLTGDVFSLKTMKFLKQQNHPMGYKVVNLTLKNSKQKIELVHRLVAKTYILNINNKPHINHIDGNKSNNLIFNLEWCTHQENMRHAWDNGLNKTSEKQREIGKINIKKAVEIGSKLKRKKIIDTSNGKIYDYAKDAANDLGLNKQTLTNWLNGNRPNKTSLKYL